MSESPTLYTAGDLRRTLANVPDDEPIVQFVMRRADSASYTEDGAMLEAADWARCCAIFERYAEGGALEAFTGVFADSVADALDEAVATSDAEAR